MNGMSAVKVEYLDTKDALKRIGGNMDLYKLLLGQFIAEDHIRPIEEALGIGEMEEASRLAHSLKGVAANLSLIKLSATAGKLEYELKNGMQHPETFDDLKNDYCITSQQIAKI